tara:strand:- start:1643 stop:1960 length:318 start_codon:yes stop_codon:yes gene_type:complete
MIRLNVVNHARTHPVSFISPNSIAIEKKPQTTKKQHRTKEHVFPYCVVRMSTFDVVGAACLKTVIATSVDAMLVTMPFGARINCCGPFFLFVSSFMGWGNGWNLV